MYLFVRLACNTFYTHLTYYNIINYTKYDRISFILLMDNQWPLERTGRVK